jgi:hypothetical protein
VRALWQAGHLAGHPHDEPGPARWTTARTDLPRPPGTGPPGPVDHGADLAGDAADRSYARRNKPHKEALRSLKRRISNAIYARLLADARQAQPATATGPGGQPGNDSDSSAAGSHPGRQLFGQASRAQSQPTAARPAQGRPVIETEPN